MQNELTPEQLQDGLAFAALIEDERVWPALERLVLRLNQDAITQWSMDKSGECSKKWLRGQREMVASILPAIQTLAQDARTQVLVAQEKETAVRTEDALGSGDLAIA